MNDLDNNKEFDEITLRELAAVIWLNKIFIVTFTTFAALVSVLYSLSLNNIYTSQTLIAPTTSSSSSGSLSQFGGLASMAGINLQQGGSEGELEIALNLVKSKKLLDRLMLYESFLPDLLAAKSWNMQTNTITYDPALYDKKNNQWVRKASLPFKQIPSSQEAIKKFSGLISIASDQSAAGGGKRVRRVMTLKVDHLSPVVAQQWSLWIVKEINAILANMQIMKSQASIDYLNSQIKITPYSELRTMFYRLIQESTQSMMLAEVNPEYVLTTIDPPVIPEMKSQPQRLPICIAGTLLGGILSVLIILVWKLVFSRMGGLDILGLR